MYEAMRGLACATAHQEPGKRCCLFLMSWGILRKWLRASADNSLLVKRLTLRLVEASL